MGTGIFDALLETLAELAGCDRSADMIDSTVVRAHHCAAGTKKRWTVRSARPAAWRLLHQASCTLRCPGPAAGFVLTPGQAHDIQRFDQSFRMIEDGVRILLAERSYDADAMRAEITLTGTRAVISARRGRRSPALHGKPHYTWRNRIERVFNKIKNSRRIAIRYDKTAASYLGFVSIALAFLWISFVHAT